MKHNRIPEVSQFSLFRILHGVLIATLLCSFPFGYTLPVLAVVPPTFIQVDVTLDSNAPAYQACTDSPDDCSLRGAITKANADNTNIYQISLPAGTYTLTQHGRLEDFNATGDLDVITGTVSIVGAGSGTTIIDANGLDRVLHVHTGVHLGLNGVAITGGNPWTSASFPGASGADGGGMYNEGSLNVQNCLISSNVAGNGSAYYAGASGGDGGGIYNEGLLFIANSTLQSNSSGAGGNATNDPNPGGDGGSGGGIYSISDVQLDSVLFEDNATSSGGSGKPGGHAGHGGGIYSSGTLTITNSTFQNNHTADGGEGTYNLGGSGGDGGAIYSAGLLTLSDSIITTNTTGRAIDQADGDAPDTHGGNGGGLYTAGTAIVAKTSFTINTTGHGPDRGGFGGSDGGQGGYGGGIYATGILTISHSTLSLNVTGNGGFGASMGSARGGDGGYGGGLFNAGICSSSYVTVTLNTTGNGGAGSGSGSEPNTVGTGGDGGHGAGIYSGGTMTLADSTISTNTSGNGASADTDAQTGGAAYGGNGGMGAGIFNAQVMTVTHTTINTNGTGDGSTGTCDRTGTGCVAYGGFGGHGGGLAQQVGAELWIADSSLGYNHTGSGGDATGDTVLNGSGGNGGAIGNIEGTLDAKYVTFQENYTSDSSNGGAIYDYMGMLSIYNSTFTKNGAFGGGEGGALFAVSDQPNLVNSLFVANWSDSYGGALAILNSSPHITNCTFVENTANWDKGAVLYNVGTGIPKIYNSILWANTGGDAIEYDATAPIVQYSIVQGGYGGTGNLNVDPAFVRDPDSGDGSWHTTGDNDYGDLRLTSVSIAIDAADNSKLPVDGYDLDGDSDFAETLPDDLYGNPRRYNVGWIADTGTGNSPIVDMGAYEYHPSHLVYLSIISRD